jgi:predicted dehydrogenase
MADDIGIGVIGFGWMGRVHTSSDRRAQPERLGFEATTHDWRAEVEHPGIQAISVTTPNKLHREIALAAIEAGKHVWVEKPVGRGLEGFCAALDERGYDGW